jgi:hypothetical protein
MNTTPDDINRMNREFWGTNRRSPDSPSKFPNGRGITFSNAQGVSFGHSGITSQTFKPQMSGVSYRPGFTMLQSNGSVMMSRGGLSTYTVSTPMYYAQPGTTVGISQPHFNPENRTVVMVQARAPSLEPMQPHKIDAIRGIIEDMQGTPKKDKDGCYTVEHSLELMDKHRW